MNYSDKKMNRYLSIAKEASEESDFPNHHLGAIFVYKGAILAKGCNTRKTSTLQKKYNRERRYDVNASMAHTNCTHAEMSCLAKIRYLDIDFSKAVLYIYREHKDGSKALSRPCKACMKAIQELNIKNIVYSTENGYCHERID